MKILSISTDRNIFKEESEVCKRMIDYGSLVSELHIIVFSKFGEDKKIGENIWIYSTKSKNKWFYIKDAIKTSKKIKGVNLITTQDPFETGIVGWRIARKLNIPLHIQIHTDLFNPYFKTGINRMRVKIAKFIIPKASCVRVVSERIKKSIENIFDNKNIKILVLPIFVDIKKIREAPITIDLHKKYPGKKIALMVSRLTKEKNIPLALKAFKRVIKKHPEAILVIAGEGPEKNKFKTQPNVFFEGFVNYNSLISYYKTADILVLSSNYDGYGMVLVEAASSGLPIVSTDVGIAGEIRDAKVVPVRNTKALYSALINQIENPQKTEVEITYSYQEYLNKIKENWEYCL